VTLPDHMPDRRSRTRPSVVKRAIYKDNAKGTLIGPATGSHQHRHPDHTRSTRARASAGLLGHKLCLRCVSVRVSGNFNDFGNAASTERS
jgi:hypothetical protein